MKSLSNTIIFEFAVFSLRNYTGLKFWRATDNKPTLDNWVT